MLERKKGRKIREKRKNNKEFLKIRREIVHYISVRQETSRQWISLRNPNVKEWSRIKDHLVKGGKVEAKES